MQRIAAIVLGILLITLGVPGIALAQNVVYVQGNIQAVDCQANTLVLKGANGEINTLPVTAYTVVFVNSAPISFCALQQYIGSYAVASVAAAENQLVTGRVDVVLAIAPPPPPYYYGYYCGYPFYPNGYYGPPFYPGFNIGVLFGPFASPFHRRFHERFFEFHHFHGQPLVGVQTAAPRFRGGSGPVPASPGFRVPSFRAPQNPGVGKFPIRDHPLPSGGRFAPSPRFHGPAFGAPRNLGPRPFLIRGRPLSVGPIGRH